MTDLNKKITTGFFWSGIEKFSVQGVQFVIGIILARLLLPSDYGVIGILLVFIAISSTFVDGGFANAIIRKKDRTEKDYCTVFYFNIFIATVFYLIIFFSSKFIADFYHNAELESLMKVLAFSLLINSISIIPVTIVTVNLNFKTQTKASLVAVFASGFIGIYLAYTGFGAWALVAQTILRSLLYTILLFFVVDWKPKLIFSIQSLRILFSYGSNILLSSLTDTIFKSIYTLVIGKCYSTQQLGLYTRAEVFAQFPSYNIMSIIWRVMYPVLSNNRDNKEAFHNMYKTYYTIALIIIFPLMFGLMALSESLIGVLLSKEWMSTANLLRIMCLSFVIHPIIALNINLLEVYGRSDLYLNYTIINRVIGAAALICTLSFGLIYICLGILISNFISMVILILFSKKTNSFSFNAQLKIILPTLFCSTTTGLAIYGVSQLFTSYFSQVLFGFTTGIFSYLLLSLIFNKKQLYCVISLFKNTCYGA